MRIANKNLSSKGSITVEACIVLPVFLSVFFLLLSFVKFTCTGMMLDYAVNEAAKEIAATAYPISFINEFEDEKIEELGNVQIPSLEEELERLVDQTRNGSFGNVLNIVISKESDITGIINLLNVVLQDYGKGIIGGIAEKITPVYWDMKSAGKYLIAESLINEQLNNPLINEKYAKLRLVEFPQGKEEYHARSASETYKKLDLIPDKDFNREDVVLQLEYDYRVNFPFVPAFNIKMVHTAVERAWTKGSFGILTNDDEGLDLEPDGGIVYITRTGIRYHKGSCRYLRKSRIPIEVGEAEEKGYTPCKVCKPER